MDAPKTMRIDIAGRGNVATHLQIALTRAGHDAACINPHTLEGLRHDCDIVLTSVTDTAIPEVAQKAALLTKPDTIIAHTSGTTPLSAISGIKPHTGVFYPMQTLSKEVEPDYSEIPFFIEGSDAATAETLLALSKGISENSRLCSSEQRRVLHVASVLCCNFTNRLWALADSYLQDNGLSFMDMLPLIKETVRKAGMSHPADVQTGPAARGDMVTIQSHLEALKGYPEIREIYKLISKSINHHLTI